MQKAAYVPKYTMEKQVNSNKNLMHQGIQLNDISKVIKIVKLFNFDPHEECSVKGYYWNTLHYSVYFKSDAILEYFLKRAYKYYPKEYCNIVNEKTCEGWSPIMIAAIYGSSDCLEVLFKCGGIQLELKDLKGKKATDLAEYYGHPECNSKIQKEIKLCKGMEYTKINHEFLMNFNERFDEIFDTTKIKYLKCDDKTIEDEDTFSILTLIGERRPCIICLSNNGYIKYTACCGQPLHTLCKKEVIKCCPICKSKLFDLISEVYYPDRAYTLDIVDQIYSAIQLYQKPNAKITYYYYKF